MRSDAPRETFVFGNKSEGFRRDKRHMTDVCLLNEERSFGWWSGPRGAAEGVQVSRDNALALERLGRCNLQKMYACFLPK